MIRKILILFFALVIIIPLLVPVPPVLAASPTTSVTITKYAADAVTILDQTTVSYEWMEDNLPIQGDGVTHYYHQGPTFDDGDLWDPEETVNWDTRDYGAAKGTDVKDLCNLVGGAPSGSEIEIKASDNFAKRFSAGDVNNPEPRQGKLVIAWYDDTYGGYVPDYDTGMRLVFFAQTTNAAGKYVFGNWDMHETLAEQYWHYYYDGDTYWPSSSGLSVQNVDRINIYTNEYILNINTIGSGSVTKNPDKATYNFGDSVTLTATPGAGWNFTGWGGNLSGSTNPTTIIMNGNKAVTATFTQSGGTGGGSTGGGGGGGMVGVLAFGYIIDSQGRISVEARCISENAEAYLLLMPGTYCLLDGSPLIFITIMPLPSDEAPPTTPEYMKVITRYFNLGPEGSTFDPPIKLIFNYDPEMIDDGTSELDMVIMRWDDQLGQWIPLESHVDPEKKIIWAEISGFSLYTVMVNTQPADISVANLTISPEKIYEGEIARVDTVLVNNGTSAGTYEIILKIDGSVKESKLVDIAENGSLIISFDLVGLATGTHKITIDNLTANVEVVEIAEPKPTAFVISSLEISPDEVNTGENINVSVWVDNTGEMEGVYRVFCRVDGVIVDEKEVTLAGGAGESVVFTLAITESGNKTIEVNELSGSLVVKDIKEDTGIIAEMPAQDNNEATEQTGHPPTPPAMSSTTSWWIILIYVAAGFIVISLIIYVFMRRRIG